MADPAPAPLQGQGPVDQQQALLRAILAGNLQPQNLTADQLAAVVKALTPSVQPSIQTGGDINAVIQNLLAGQRAQTPPAAPQVPASAALTAAPRLARPVIGTGQAPQAPQNPAPQTARTTAQNPQIPQTAPADPPLPMIRPGSDSPVDIREPSIRRQGDPANTNVAPAVSPLLLQLVQSLPPDMRAAELEAIANDQRLTQAMVDKQNRQSKLIDQMTAMPAPTFHGIDDQALRAPPPVPDIQPIKAFQNWGVSLAMLGSLLTRRPLTSALKSGAAAMKAYNEGRWKDFFAQRQNWKDSVDLAMKQNELEYQRYEAARETYRDDLDKLQLAYQEIATEYGDQVALHDIANGEFDRFLAMRKQLLDEQYRLAALNARHRYGQGGMTSAQRYHDFRIKQARAELEKLGINWQDPGYLGTLKNANAGMPSEDDKYRIKLYDLANQPLVSDMMGLSGLDGSPGDSTVDPSNPPSEGAIPTPSMFANQPSGHRFKDPDTGQGYITADGGWSVPTDEQGNPLHLYGGDLGVGDLGPEDPTLGDPFAAPLNTDPANEPLATSPQGGRFGGGFLRGHSP